eukprot:CAMPEP_0172439878 /NCGR_PEP_ID=MMETSP1065-20121228/728_1 /TAXON_ID=265537 /ORGANISM="Amphiprora paludosa, Strain CCMP125" /LENGTH=649 /DNA_ID=CAMNT_0013188631 /DNA_START=251 /DNA_END=2200 /DNA_ORIENTATION=-
MTASASALAASTQQDQEQQTAAQKRKAAAKAVSPFTSQEQLQALDSLLEGSDNADFDARHIFGYKDPNHEPSMLQIITATRILDYNQEMKDATATISDLEEQAKSFRQEHGPAVNLQEIIQQQAKRGTMALAAEFKRASPSKGIMASDLNLTAAQQTSIYAQSGANIISILTEPRWFLGGFNDLTQARLATAEQRPAILCKEFVVNEYMIAQAAAAGADTCLLIVAVLPQHVLAKLIAYARSLDMEPLVEVHAMEELDVALAAGAKVIGVNNRNLHTFQMDLANSERIAEELTKRGLTFSHSKDSGEERGTEEYTLCALSGMSSAADVDRYRQAGLQMCLIGESLMRSSNPGQAIQGLCLNEDDYAAAKVDGSGISASGAYTAGCKIVKVCGITNPDDALVACQSGVNLIGVIFAEKSKRKVTAEQAKAVVAAVRDFGERQERHTFAPADQGASPLQHLLSASQQLVQGATTRRPLVVGVFQNQDPDFVAQMVQDCGLDLVQLHGKEGFAAANPSKNGGVPAIRVVDITVDPETGKAADNAVEQILDRLTNDPVAILLDTAIKGKDAGGGTSTTFDWNIAQAVQNAGLPVLVAGGLTSSNVADCVTNTRPFGVDVSSGVEQTPGRKNHDEVKAFVRTARQAAIEASQGF